MIKHIIFDFFGVMVSEPAHKEREIWSKTLGVDEKILNPILNKYREACNQGRMSSYQFRESIHEDLGIDIFYDADTMFLKTLKEVRPYPKMFDLIPKLKEAWYSCTLLSDVFLTDKIYVAKQWRYDAFDDIILSCDIGLSKSQDYLDNTQKIFEYALAKYKQNAEECIFIDDREPNCEAAERAGIQTIQATSPEVTIQKLKDILDI